jgi:hypothetical protein
MDARANSIAAVVGLVVLVLVVLLRLPVGPGLVAFLVASAIARRVVSATA